MELCAPVALLVDRVEGHGRGRRRRDPRDDLAHDRAGHRRVLGRLVEAMLAAFDREHLDLGTEVAAAAR